MKSKGLLFSHKLRTRAQHIRSWLCVGLDPELHRLPAGLSRSPAGLAEFCGEIVAATEPYAAAFKINFAFFEALGVEGWRALERVRTLIPPGVVTIADAKRGDIGSTAQAYARSIFENLDFDAVTLSPYLGWDALEPFTSSSGRGLFILCKTSNPGATDFQDLLVDGEPLYLKVARSSLAAPAEAELGLVVGATYPSSLRRVRALDEDLIFLVPGVGAQGATPRSTFALAANAAGENALIAVSRSILYASTGSDFADAAAGSAGSIVSELRA